MQSTNRRITRLNPLFWTSILGRGTNDARAAGTPTSMIGRDNGSAYLSLRHTYTTDYGVGNRFNMKLLYIVYTQKKSRISISCEYVKTLLRCKRDNYSSMFVLYE